MQGWQKNGAKENGITVRNWWFFKIWDFSLLSSLGYTSSCTWLNPLSCSTSFAALHQFLFCNCQTSKLPIRQKKKISECIVSIQTKSKEHFVKNCSNHSSMYESFSLLAVHLISCCKHSKRLPVFQWKHKKEGKTNLAHCFFYPLVSKPTNHQLCLTKDFGNLPWQSKYSTVTWGLEKMV